jgi:hypothetical protein
MLIFVDDASFIAVCFHCGENKKVGWQEEGRRRIPGFLNETTSSFHFYSYCGTLYGRLKGESH